MEIRLKTFRLGLPTLLITAIVVLPLLLVFFVFFVLWGLIAQVLLGRSFSRTLKGNTIFTRTMGQRSSSSVHSDSEVHFRRTSTGVNTSASLEKPVIEVEGHVIQEDSSQR